jgi:hypothetical protein
MRATYVKHHGKPSLPPIQVTIVGGEHDVGIRISDQGKGQRLFLKFTNFGRGWTARCVWSGIQPRRPLLIFSR